MGTAVSLAKGSNNGRSKTFVTQLKQENVRLQARIDRLSAEAKRLKEEINTMLREKEQEKRSVNGAAHFPERSPRNANERDITSEQEVVSDPESFTEKVLQLELDTLMKEKHDLKSELEKLKAKGTCEDYEGYLVCTRKSKREEVDETEQSALSY